MGTTNPRIFVVVTNLVPFIHAGWHEDGRHNPNQTICGIQRGTRRTFLDTEYAFLDIAENIEKILPDVVCGICWWQYTRGTCE